MIADLIRKMIERDEARIAAARRLLELVDGDPLAELDDTDPTPPAGVIRARCAKCGRGFKSAAGLGRHRSTVCAGDAAGAAEPTPAPRARGPVFECEEPECEYGCDEASKMIRHTLQAHGRRPLPTERTPQAVTA